MAGLIAALDTADAGKAQAWADMLAPHCGMMKLGLEFMMAQGPAGVRGIAARPVFLDLKLHDIPNTVAGAVLAILPLRPHMVTLHAAGGSAMIEAARRAAESVDDRPLLLAVTVLTSLDSSALHATGVAGGPRQQVLRLARLALAAGADGLVCSAHEASMLRDALGRCPGAGRAGHPSGGRRPGRSDADDDAAAGGRCRRGLDRCRPSDHERRRSRPCRCCDRSRNRMIRVKICGINTDDAMDAAADADYIGFNFFPPSPRSVTPDRAAALSRAHPGGPARVGLFVDPTDDEVEAVLAALPLDVLQVHASPGRAAGLQARFGVSAWAVVGVADATDLPSAMPGVAGLLLDAKAPPNALLPGGNATVFDWSILRRWTAPMQWMLAGGLTPDNVADAVRISGALAVDVASGVESSRGVKAAELIRSFIVNARTGTSI